MFASGFLPRIFFKGGRSIVMQISFVMLIFLLFSDQISGDKILRGGRKLPQGGERPPVEESQASWAVHTLKIYRILATSARKKIKLVLITSLVNLYQARIRFKGSLR